MNIQDLTTLVRFNFWANDRLLDACDRLSLDAFTRPVNPDPGRGGLRGILVHVLDAEFGWRSVLQARDDDYILEENDFRDASALRARWVEEKAAWFAYLRELQDADLDRPYRADQPDGPNVWQVIVHVVAHGIQHRGEAAWVLTGYGASPGELDFGVYLKEESAP